VGPGPSRPGPKSYGGKIMLVSFLGTHALLVPVAFYPLLGTP
jgi:hypothetical protein